MKRLFFWILIGIVALSNYEAAVLLKNGLIRMWPQLPTLPTLAICWGAIVILLFRLFPAPNHWYHKIQLARDSWILIGLCLVGLGLFLLSPVRAAFHAVRSPLFFTLVTPIIEEGIFRGWLYERIKLVRLGSPVLITALLFSLHHLQYYNYHVTPFALFQMAYTFALGLLLGQLRQKSESLVPGVLVHILLNTAVLL